MTKARVENDYSMKFVSSFLTIASLFVLLLRITLSVSEEAVFTTIVCFDYLDDTREVITY
jgi:hypothetical protein